MIATIALNPGIEKYIDIDKYNEGSTIAVDSYELRISGSSVHSAYIMRLLQAEPYVLGFAGGIGGRYIKNFLDKNRIKSNLITKDKELKTTILITNSLGVTTKLIDDEEAFTEVDAKNIKHKLVAQIDEAELLLINGSIAHEGSRTIIHQSIELIKHAHKILLLSFKGREVRPFMEMSPLAIMLDELQVEALTDGAETLEDTLEQLRQIGIQNRIHYIFFATGNQVIGITRNKIAYGTIPGTKHVPLPWRKEAIAGGMAIGIKRGYEFERILKLMTSVSYSISEDDYPVLSTRKKIESLMNKAKILDYYSNDVYHMGD